MPYNSAPFSPGYNRGVIVSPGAASATATVTGATQTVCLTNLGANVCYIRFGDGFFEDQLGGGFIGRKDTAPLALNNPRQGDLVVGPQAGGCPAIERGAISARY